MTDTHTHLYLTDSFPEGEGSAAIERAMSSGVARMVFPNVDESTIKPMLALHSLFPENTYIASGLHPTEVNERWQDAMANTLDVLDKEKCVAIGEVGIDLYWDKTFRTEQMDCFEAQLREAKKRDLPVIIHCRDGLDEVLEVFSRLDGDLPAVLFHSFTGGKEDVCRIREHTDAWFGINGVVTFKNAKELQEAVPTIGLDRIVLETDSPYLAPVPYRGKRNESAYLPKIAEKIAELTDTPVGEVERATDRNAASIFRF